MRRLSSGPCNRGDQQQGVVLQLEEDVEGDFGDATAANAAVAALGIRLGGLHVVQQEAADVGAHQD